MRVSTVRAVATSLLEVPVSRAEWTVRRTERLGWGPVLTFALFVGGCGGGGSQPGAPPTPVPTGTLEYVFVDGVSGTPVSARVAVDGGASGEGTAIRVPGVAEGSDVAISAQRYLERSVVARIFAPLTVHLWPDRPGLEAQLTRELLYLGGSEGQESTLIRIVASTAYVRLDATLDGPQYAMALEEAVAKVRAAVRWLTITTAEAPSDGVVCTLRLDETSEYPAVSSRTLGSRRQIRRGSIVFRDASYATNQTILVHELGHFLGLGHLESFEGIMRPDGRAFEYSTFSGHEAEVLWLMQFRDPGNAFPDDGRGTASVTSGGQADEVVCTFALPALR